MTAFVIEQRSAEPCWSPDGKSIVYSDHERYGVYVTDVRGTQRKLVGTGESPVWTPDSQRVVFRFGYKLRTVHVVTGESTLIAGSGWGDPNIDEFALSHDGMTVAFVEDHSSTNALYVAKTEVPLRRLMLEVPHSTSIGSFTWSPESQWLALSIGGDVYMLDTRNGEKRVIVHDAYRPAWSPMGDTIACMREKEMVLFNIHRSESSSVKLSSSLFFECDFGWARPIWSPNGRYLAFDQIRKNKGPFRGDEWQHTISALRMSDKRVIELLEGVQESSSSPTWSPDSSRLAATLAGDSEFFIHIVEVRDLLTQRHA